MGLIAGVGDFGLTELRDETLQYRNEAQEILDSIENLDNIGILNASTGVATIEGGTVTLTATPPTGWLNGQEVQTTISGNIGFGGVNFTSGTTVNVGDKLRKRGTQWELIPFAISDYSITGTKISKNAKVIKDWEAISYITGAQVYREGGLYEANQSVISTDVPSTSSTKWNRKFSPSLFHLLPYSGNIVIDTVLRKISTTGRLFIASNLEYIDTDPSASGAVQASTDWDSDNITGLHFIVVNRTTKALAVVKFDRIGNYSKLTYATLGYIEKNASNNIITNISYPIIVDGKQIGDNTKTDLTLFYEQRFVDVLSFDGTISINSSARTISVTERVFLVNNGKAITVSTQASTAWDSDSASVTNFIVYDTADNKIKVVKFDRIVNYDLSKLYYLGIITKGATAPYNGRVQCTIKGRYILDSKLHSSGFNHDFQTCKVMPFTGYLSLNTTARTVETTGQVFVVTNSAYLTKSTQASTAWDSSTGSGIHYVLFNANTNSFQVVRFDSSVLNTISPADTYLVGYVGYDNSSKLQYQLSTTAIIDGTLIDINNIKDAVLYPEFIKYKRGSVLRFDGDLVITSATKKVEVTGRIFIGRTNGYIDITSVQASTDWDSTAGSGIHFVLVHETTKIVSVVRFDRISSYDLKSYICLGHCGVDNAGVFQHFISGTYIANGISYPEKIAPINEMVLPSSIYLLNGLILPIFKSSMLRKVDDWDNKHVIANVSDTDTDYNYPTYQNFEYSHNLDPSVTKNAIRIYSKNLKDTSDYAVDITISKANQNAKTGLTKVWSALGDSITNRGVQKFTSAYALSIGGLTLSCVGTINNTGKQGEGREGWTYSNFIGKKNLHTNGTVITRLADGATTSGLYENPFLRLATGTDTTNHPTWCFRNTGSSNELSYQSDPDKTGNFYIFDYAYYLSSHSITNPDLITIGLGTNDIFFFLATGITDSLFSLEVMLNQIYTALPSAKVGVILPSLQGISSTRNLLVLDFINQMQAKVATLAISNTYVVPTWIHMNKDFIYPYNAGTNLQGDGNLTKKYTLSDYIHFGRDGYLLYAKALTSFIINII